MLQLMVVWLGGKVESFKFRRPGADHHARWMSKAIYNLKLRLLSEQFDLDTKQQEDVKIIAEFCGLFYVKAFLKCPLPCSAPRNDLVFMSEVLHWRLLHPRLAFTVLKSCYVHLWYLTPQMVVVSLLDEGYTADEREAMALQLYYTERSESVEIGKPKFPEINWKADGSPPDLKSFISSKSWLIFDLLGLTNSQEWLQTPCSLWDMFSDFRKFKEFCVNLTVVNDLAERGVYLISDFIGMCKDETQREALVQVVEHHRKLFPDYTKKTLSKL